MKCLVTGTAGFIGSHLSEQLIRKGYEVIGIDSFNDYYSPQIKEANIVNLLKEDKFKLIRGNLINLELMELVLDVDYILHLSAQPGVRKSWGKQFEEYIENNINVTQRLLEVAKESKRLKKFVYASSSSVYGEPRCVPMYEDMCLQPISPYGVTKLAAENLCCLYRKNFGLPTVSLRYFTVYGPKQRPDMAFYKFINSILEGQPITVYGDGNQKRDFTFVSDCVEATIAAIETTITNELPIFNIASGNCITVNDVIRCLEYIMGQNVFVNYISVQHGDVLHTYADISQARDVLNYRPHISIKEGLTKEIQWLQEFLLR